MPKPAVCVVRAPGTNCDAETAHAFSISGARAESVHAFRLLESPARLDDYQILCVPGGFSYGDDIGAGVIFARQLRGRLGEAIGRFLAADKLVLGICNGFQVLLKAGILPGGESAWPPDERQNPPATLTWNDNGRYTAVWVRLAAAGPSVFLNGIEQLELPVAHAEGRFVVGEDSLIEHWRGKGQIALRYSLPRDQSGERGADTPAQVREPGAAPLPFPFNPNGSAADVAGLSDPTGRVLGLMPHPERFIHATQHPRWTRLQLSGNGAGLRLFQNAVEYFG